MVLVSDNNEDFFIDNISILDYNIDNGLIIDEGENEYQQYILDFAKEKLRADAVFFYKSNKGTNVPLIYFKKMLVKNRKEIANLHKLLWNKGEVPFYFIVLPNEILIYSSYKIPKLVQNELDYTAGLLDELKVLNKFNKKLREYTRSEILSGSYWEKNKDLYKKDNHVSENLLNNLEYMKEQLLLKELSKEHIHSIIIRSMFIKYLEDRKDLNGKNVFPESFFSKFLLGAKSFIDLLTDKDATYEFFNFLNIKFNGDTFEVNKVEISDITEDHLNLLKRMLSGEEYLKNRQMVLWPLYSFDVIPIELLSVIYQAFFHSEKRTSKLGTYYTPKFIVEYMLNGVLPWSMEKKDIKTLDPACGSGIFLVEAYRRQINAHISKNGKIEFNEMWNILKKNIFGVDINYQAIQVTAFSLYLTICDYLEPKAIWYDVKFEPLIGSNLIVSDFFDENIFDRKKEFDIIIGNPPWERKLTKKALDYLNKYKLPIGNKQIFELFLWRIGKDLLSPSGVASMIVGSKSLLFNRRKTDIKFRKEFFESYNIKMILNLSELRYSLFSESNVPA